MTIPYVGAAFQLYDPDGNKIVMSYTYPEYTEIDTFYTTEDGMLITPQKLPYGKDYSLVEVTAPYGYVLDSTPIFFNVTADTATGDGAITVVKVKRPNMPQKGIIKITKTGEVFQTVTEQSGVYQPVYEIGKLSGAVFEIRVAEDIYTLDGVLHYTKGEVIDTVTSGSDGIAVSKQLYLGKYFLQERSTDSHYILCDTKFPFEFAYAGQDVEVVEITANNGEAITNNLKYGSVSGLKVDEDGKTIAGAKFGLFRNDETEYTEKNALMTAVSGENGIFRFDNIPVGTWVVRELVPAEGFVLNELSYQVTITAHEQVIEITLENRYIRSDILGHKVDEDGEVISGALFGLFKDGTEEFTEDAAFMTAASGPDGKFLFENVRYGKWIVKELSCPEQYVLSGAEFEIYLDVNGNQTFDPGIDTLIGKLTESETGFYEMDGLKHNGYFLFESKAPEGFQKDDRYF